MLGTAPCASTRSSTPPPRSNARRTSSLLRADFARIPELLGGPPGQPLPLEPVPELDEPRTQAPPPSRRREPRRR